MSPLPTAARIKAIQVQVNSSGALRLIFSMTVQAWLTAFFDCAASCRSPGVSLRTRLCAATQWLQAKLVPRSEELSKHRTSAPRRSAKQAHLFHDYMSETMCEKTTAQNNCTSVKTPTQED